MLLPFLRRLGNEPVADPAHSQQMSRVARIVFDVAAQPDDKVVFEMVRFPSAIHDGGDHSIIVGDVLWAEVAEHDVDNPLLYFRSHYGTIVRSMQSEKTLQSDTDA